MSAFPSHIDALIGGPQDSGSNNRNIFDEWASSGANVKDINFDDPTGVDTEQTWNTVVDMFLGDVGNSVLSPVTSKVLSLPDAKNLRSSIHAVLWSSRPNDAISGELVDLVGFDNIEMVAELIANREVVTQELAAVDDLLVEGSGKHLTKGVSSIPLFIDDARQRMEAFLRENASRPLFSGTAEQLKEDLPHVYSSSTMAQGNVLSHLGSKYTLPMGTVEHEKEDHKEVILPPSKPVPPKLSERLITVAELDPLAKGSFPGYSSLNRVQSIVYPTAYGSNENMLICAPTGAGKTDVAMLSVLRVIDQHRSGAASMPLAATIERKDFKIIYVAPMKALAAEIVRKLGARLKWLSINVRELTGDMQLTKAEIAETQIIVTTPEKWDVVTRKPTGEGEIASKVRLLIIDEVHLLNDERGAVIETIVARTLRQVESSQSVIRIVGLSATLPNYVDVAEFLSVNKQRGLFYFDSSFRPVPLEQHFIGVKGKAGSPTSRKNLDNVVYEKVSEIVKRGHQVMVFVHARKETVKSALTLKDAAMQDGTLEDFSCEEHPQWSFFRRELGQSRNKEMKQLFDNGFGIHHAGMLRSDRNMMERMFQARAIKVLFCTATLAWGVNMPAHAVVIKGTQVYDSARGSFVDLSVLDVLQVFGRAGRPGLETEGEGYICTTEDKLQHYLDAVTSQVPIESRFTAGIVDSLNAEISLGTVANVQDAVQWLGYTYMFVRMRKNPFQYGLPRDEPLEDPHLGNKRAQLATVAAQKLADAGMIAFDRQSGAFVITDLGRIAAKYYIRHASIEIFNKEFRPGMTEADALVILCQSTEFDQIQVRDTELKELKSILDVHCQCDVKGVTYAKQGDEDKHSKGKASTVPKVEVDLSNQAKVNILLQGYISGAYVEDFALVSDTAYAAQNGARIIRALLEIAISRKWANASTVLMSMSKAIEKRMWPFNQPLLQFHLKKDALHGLETWADDWSPADLAALEAREIGELIHLNEQHGAAVQIAARQLPAVEIAHKLRPLGADVLRISVSVIPAFTWNAKVHGSVEPFWLWVEDAEGMYILQLSHLFFRPTTESLDVDFVISIPNGTPPSSITVRFVSDRWMGAEDNLVIPLESLIMPQWPSSHTPRLDLPFLSLSALQNPMMERVFSRKLHGFNAIQTQAFWGLVRTHMHALLCAPTGCGKTALGLATICNTLKDSRDGSWVLVVAPRRTLAIEMLSDLRHLTKSMGVAVSLLFDGDSFTPVKGKAIRVVLGAQLVGILPRLRGSLADLRLVLCENLEQLTSAYELGVSLLRHATEAHTTRFVGISSSLNDAADLAAWLDVDPFALHSFRPRDRDQSLSISTHTFTIPQSAALFKAMAKPAHSAITSATSREPVIVFVPSRGQCFNVARDLITQCALQAESGRGYLPDGFPEEHLEDRLARLKDISLTEFVSHGIGFFYDGFQKDDRALMLEMYAEGLIRVMIVPREASWTLPVRASIVVVMGTQYIHVDPRRDERQVRDYGLDELVQMQGRAVRHNALGHFHLFCQAEGKDTFTRFLDDGLPLESHLLEDDVLRRWYTAERASGQIANKQQAVEALAWTFLARRLVTNPMYYDCAPVSLDESLSRIVDRLDEALAL